MFAVPTTRLQVRASRDALADVWLVPRRRARRYFAARPALAKKAALLTAFDPGAFFSCLRPGNSRRKRIPFYGVYVSHPDESLLMVLRVGCAPIGLIQRCFRYSKKGWGVVAQPATIGRAKLAERLKIPCESRTYANRYTHIRARQDAHRPSGNH